jgi:hypothetical protein
MDGRKQLRYCQVKNMEFSAERGIGRGEKETPAEHIVLLGLPK